MTDFPSARPPAARIMMVQRKLLKSSLVRIPVPKNRTMGMMATTPISPRTGSSWCVTHHSAIVMMVTMLINHCIPEKLSLMGRIGTIVVLRPGLKVASKRIQIRRMDMIQTGRAMKNHLPQSSGGDMFWRAMRFWGDAMGEAAPPMFEDSAMPRRSALVIEESEGRLRRMGWSSLVTWHEFNSTVGLLG